MAAAAATLGLVVFAFPALSWQYQLLLFAVLSLVSTILFRLYQRTHPPRSDQPALNRRGEQYIGRTFSLGKPIVNGIGEIRVDDTTWRIVGNDLPDGTKVEVIGVNGVALQVVPKSA